MNATIIKKWEVSHNAKNSKVLSNAEFFFKKVVSCIIFGTDESLPIVLKTKTKREAALTSVNLI